RHRRPLAHEQAEPHRLAALPLSRPAPATAPFGDPGRPESTAHQLRRALTFAAPHRASIALILVLTLAVATISSIEPLVLKLIIDGLTAGRGMSAVGLGLLFLGIMSVFREGASGTSNWLTWRMRIGLQYALLEATVERLHRMPLK